MIGGSHGLGNQEWLTSIFLQFLWLLSKSPCTGGGLGDPVLYKVPSAPDLAQPKCDYVNSHVKKIKRGCTRSKSMPQCTVRIGCARSRALRTLHGAGSPRPRPVQGDLLNSHQTNFGTCWFLNFLLDHWFCDQHQQEFEHRQLFKCSSVSRERMGETKGLPRWDGWI